MPQPQPFRKYAVMSQAPSGYHCYYSTDDKQEAEAVAASEQSRTGWPHFVFKQA